MAHTVVSSAYSIELGRQVSGLDRAGPFNTEFHVGGAGERGRRAITLGGNVGNVVPPIVPGYVTIT